MSKQVSVAKIDPNVNFSGQIKEGDYLILYLSDHVAFFGKVDTVDKDHRTARFNLTSIKYDDSRTYFAWTDIGAAHLLQVVDLKPSDTVKADFLDQKQLVLSDDEKKQLRGCLESGNRTILVLLKEGASLPMSLSRKGVRVRT